MSLEAIFDKHRRWNAQHAAPLAREIGPHTNVRDPNRRIRVCFPSPNFGRYPVGYMITPAVEALDGTALADLRSGLRAGTAASPLCGGPRFARNLEAAFRAMWVRWCEEPTPPPFAQPH